MAAAFIKGATQAGHDVVECQEWTDRGQLIVPGVLNKGDVLSTNYLDLAEKMGRSI